jgi:quinol-cytochrome oxidoreductase complex cytochrome b subunit
VGVLFFGFCGVVVLLTPFLDRGRRSRSILSGLAAVAVAFFIVMTAWGWFSKPDQIAWRIALGALLTVIALFLLVPLTEPKTGMRRLVYGFLTLAAITLLAAASWKVFA